MESTSDKRIFVLDTNVLMHDPCALLRFEEHHVYLPMVVLEELDEGKKGLSEVARNVRQTNRFLDELINDHPDVKLIDGLPLPTKGKLFLQIDVVTAELPSSLPGVKPDNTILATVLGLKKAHPGREITLVSKDINLRIKATMLDIHAEDFTNDRVLDDVNDLHRGLWELPASFWETQDRELQSWKKEEKLYYRIQSPNVMTWFPNDSLVIKGEKPFHAVVSEREGEEAIIEVVTDYSQEKRSVWGINARNREQNFALNHLLNPEIDFVTLQGTAGSGKTLLALAAGLEQTLEFDRYSEIIMTRVTVPVGEDIGFLPGTEEEKMTPWMGALLDNLEVLQGSDDNDDWNQQATQDVLNSKIKVRSLNFMRGRTFLNKYIIIDEAQNLTSKQIKTLITRAGPGSKLVCLGDVRQIDTPYLTGTTSGLTYAVDRFKAWAHSAHITLMRGERSRLADYAADIL